MEKELVLLKDGAIEIQVNVELEKDTVWLTANQMALLFEKDEKTIRKHDRRDKNVAIYNDTEKMMKENDKLQAALKKAMAEQTLYLEQDLLNMDTVSGDVRNGKKVCTDG